MRTFIAEGTGRIIVLNLEPGELLLESIRAELVRLQVRDAVLVSAIGTLSKARYHRITGTDLPPKDEFLVVEAPVELSAVQGLVADGEPHFHMVFTDFDRTYSGHLEDGCVVAYLAELVLMEIKGARLRREHSQDGIKLLEEA